MEQGAEDEMEVCDCKVKVEEVAGAVSAGWRSEPDEAGGANGGAGPTTSVTLPGLWGRR